MTCVCVLGGGGSSESNHVCAGLGRTLSHAPAALKTKSLYIPLTTIHELMSWLLYKMLSMWESVAQLVSKKAVQPTLNWLDQLLCLLNVHLYGGFCELL